MNKTSLIGTAAIAALSVISTSAFATATATAEITGLTISLSQIKSTGPAPTATFTVGSADSFLTYAYSYDPYTYQNVTTYGGSAVGTGGQSAGNAVVNSSATLTGDAYSDDGAILSTSATASGTNGNENYALAEILLGSNSGSTTFTLGKNTRLDISAEYTITGNLTGAVTGSNYEYAYAQVWLQLAGTNGANSQSSTAGTAAVAQHYFGTTYSPSFSQSGELDVTFAGSKNSITTGQFYGIAESYAYSNVSSVPEPTNAAFLLGGLAAVGLLARRRRAN